MDGFIIIFTPEQEKAISLFIGVVLISAIIIGIWLTADLKKRGLK